jgi:hypothetical protein
VPVSGIDLDQYVCDTRRKKKKTQNIIYEQYGNLASNTGTHCICMYVIVCISVALLAQALSQVACPVSSLAGDWHLAEAGDWHLAEAGDWLLAEAGDCHLAEAGDCRTPRVA